MWIGVAAVLAVLIAVLAIPVGLRFDICWHGALEQRVDLSWAFGLVRVRLGRPNERRAAHRQPARGPRKKPRARSQKRRAHLLRALRLKPFRRRLLSFLRSLWHAIHKEDLRLDVRAGLGDPADTGRLWAVVGPVSGMLRQVPDVAVSLQPDFNDATFELDSSGMLRVMPLNVVLIVAALLVSPAFWHGVRAAHGRA